MVAFSSFVRRSEEAGEQMLRRVRPAMAELEDAVNEAAAARDRPSGSIRIRTAELRAMPIIQHVLPSFMRTCPDIHVEMVADTWRVDTVVDGSDAGGRVRDDVTRDMTVVSFGPDWGFVAVAAPLIWIATSRCGRRWCGLTRGVVLAQLWRGRQVESFHRLICAGSELRAPKAVLVATPVTWYCASTISGAPSGVDGPERWLSG